MILKKLTLSLILALTALTAVAQKGGSETDAPQLRLSLQEAQDYAVAHNYALQNAALDIQKAEATRWQTLSSMLPQVKAGFDYQNMCGYEMNFGGRSSMGSMLPDSITIGGMTMPISFPESSSSDASAATSIPMNPSGTFSITASIALTGAQIVGTLLNNIAIDMANISRNQSEHSTRTNVKTTYTSILIMEQTVRLLDTSLQNMLQLLASTEASVRAGASEQINADKLKVQVASMRSNINSTQRSLKLLYNSMVLLLGADVNSRLELTTPLEQARKQVSMAWMDFTPTISAYYQYSDKTYFGKDAGFNMTPPNMIGANVSLPLFQSGTRLAKVKSAKIDLQETLNNKQQAEDGLKVQYNQLCYDLVSAIENYQIQHENLDVTRRVFKNVSEKYTYGHASNLEVTNASTDIITAQSNYIQAVMSVVQAQVALENLLGRAVE